MFRELFETKIEIDDIPLFADSLQMYIMYNDKDSIQDLLDMDLTSIFTKPKKLYRIIRGSSSDDFIMNEFGITSASTGFNEQLIKDMKDTINQYRKTGDYYLQEISKAEGFDVNKLASSFKKDKSLKKFDVPGNEPVGALMDVFKQFKSQKEFIIFGDYKVTKSTRI